MLIYCMAVNPKNFPSPVNLQDIAPVVDYDIFIQYSHSSFFILHSSHGTLFIFILFILMLFCLTAKNVPVKAFILQIEQFNFN